MVSLLFLFLLVLVLLLVLRCYCGCCSCRASHGAWTGWRLDSLRSEVQGLKWGRPRVSCQAPRAFRSLLRRAKNVGRADQRITSWPVRQASRDRPGWHRPLSGPTLCRFLSLSLSLFRLSLGWPLPCSRLEVGMEAREVGVGLYWVPAGSLMGPCWVSTRLGWAGPGRAGRPFVWLYVVTRRV